jgi:hypothetical protein
MKKSLPWIVAGLLPNEVWVFCFENPGVIKPLLDVNDLQIFKLHENN